MDHNDVPLMCVSHLNKRFDEGYSYCRGHSVKLQGNHYPKCGTIYAYRDISFDVYDGEILDVVGENGNGKSTMMQHLYSDQEVIEGSRTIRTYRDGAANTFEPTTRRQRYIRSHVLGMVYQNPYLGLKMNFFNMGDIAEKPTAVRKRNVKAMSERGEGLLSAVRIPVHYMKEEPRKFSDGMQQHVQTTKALSNSPSVLLLDEVTTGPDLSVQVNVLDLIKKTQWELGVSMLAVLHDPGMVRILTNRTIVMLDGKITEQGLTDQVIEDPQYPYTQQLAYSLL